MEAVALAPAIIIALLMAVCVLLVVFLLRYERRFEKLEIQVFKLELDLARLERPGAPAETVPDLPAQRRA